MKAQKILISENTQATNQIARSIDQTKEAIEGVIREWKELSETPLTIPLLQSFFMDARARTINQPAIELILKREMAMRANLSSPLLNADKVLALMNAPEIGLLIAKLRAFSRIYGPDFRDMIYWNCFTIAGDQVKIIPEAVEQAKESFREYAEGAEQIERLELVSGIIGAMNKIRERYPDIPTGRYAIAGLVTESSGQLVPSWIFINRATFDGGRPRPMFATPLPDVKPINLKIDPPVMAGFVPTGEEEVAAAIAQRRNNPTLGPVPSRPGDDLPEISDDQYVEAIKEAASQRNRMNEPVKRLI